MIEDLLNAKLISPKEYKIHRLYSSELGQECIKEMMEELFWEEPSEEFFTEAHFAFYDGRRSILRGIKSVIGKVEATIQKQQLANTQDD